MKKLIVIPFLLLCASVFSQKYVQEFTKTDGTSIAISLSDLAFAIPSGTNNGSVLVLGPNAKTIYVTDSLQGIVDSSSAILVLFEESYKLNGKDALRDIAVSKQQVKEVVPSGASQTFLKLASPQKTILINDDYATVAAALSAASSGGDPADGNGIYSSSGTIPLYTRATVLPDEDYLQPEFSIGAIPEWDSIDGGYLFGDDQFYNWITISPEVDQATSIYSRKSFEASLSPTVWERRQAIEVDYEAVRLDLIYNEEPDNSGENTHAGFELITNVYGPSGYYSEGELFCESSDNSTGEIRKASLAFGTNVNNENGITGKFYTTYEGVNYTSQFTAREAYTGISTSDDNLGTSSSVGAEANRVVITQNNRIASFKDNSIYLGPETEADAHSIKWGSGDPNTVVTANPGSIYMNTLGGAGATMWVKESGTGNTGWVAK